MNIKNIISRALLFFAGVCIFLALCNLFYIAFFIRGPQSWFPIEILLSILLVFLAAIFPLYFFYTENLLSLPRFKQLRKKLNEKEFFGKMIWWWIFWFSLLVMNIPGKQSANPSLLQIFTESNILYVMCYVFLLSIFWVSTFTLCVVCIKKINDKLKKLAEV